MKFELQQKLGSFLLWHRSNKETAKKPFVPESIKKLSNFTTMTFP